MKKNLYFLISILGIFLLLSIVQPSFSNDGIRTNTFAAKQTYNGFYCYIAGDYKSAIKYFSKAIQLEPNDFVTHHQRGLAYYNLKKYKKALSDYNKAIELNPEYADAYYYRSLVKLKLKDYQGASEDIESVLKIAPEYSKAIKQKECLSAKEYSQNQNIKSEMERIENSASGQSGKGFLSVIKGDDKSAIEHFSKSIEIEPNNPIVYHQRGIAYYNLGNYQDALKDLNQTIKLDPNLIDAYGNRSLVKMELKDYKGALADINEVLKIAPEHPKAIEQKKTILSKMDK